MVSLLDRRNHYCGFFLCLGRYRSAASTPWSSVWHSICHYPASREVCSSSASPRTRSCEGLWSDATRCLVIVSQICSLLPHSSLLAAFWTLGSSHRALHTNAWQTRWLRVSWVVAGKGYGMARKRFANPEGVKLTPPMAYVGGRELVLLIRFNVVKCLPILSYSYKPSQDGSPTAPRITRWFMKDLWFCNSRGPLWARNGLELPIPYYILLSVYFILRSELGH